ncbi:hypothetical protein FLAN108750_10370 [Flavobacterium antarcticum]|uniref:hypothetical protein n=1 Tax=Flavobacterium antarcticum TaxID=271155 RepID=UPI0003B6F265|nr:hypothetical protein [Flavobacterium antarcticum]
MKRTLQIANGIALVATIIINYLSNTGLLNGKTIGDVSNGLTTLFTPAGYAFAIWGFIYLLLIGFIFYQGKSLFSSNTSSDEVVLKIGWWFVISCIANSAWVFLWIYGYTGLSCLFILLLLYSLLQIIFRCRLELDLEPFTKMIFIAWPFVFYAGWVTVASIANISAYLFKINWDGFGIAADNWAIVMIVVAVLVNIWAIKSRNLREFAVVGAWALIAIGVRNQEAAENVANIAYIGAVTLLLACAVDAFSKFRKGGFSSFFLLK